MFLSCLCNCALFVCSSHVEEIKNIIIIIVNFNKRDINLCHSQSYAQSHHSIYCWFIQDDKYLPCRSSNGTS